MLLFCSMRGYLVSDRTPSLVSWSRHLEVKISRFWRRTSLWLRDLFLVFCPIFDLAVGDWREAAKSKIKGLPVTICKNCVACLRSQRDLPLSQVDNGSVSFVGPNLSAHVELRKLDLEKL